MLFILLIAVLASCKKTTNVDISLSTSGKLTYKLLDDAGKGMPNVAVSLFDNLNNSSNTTILLDKRLTDEKGIADFGDLNPHNYLVVPDSPMVNNVKYNIPEYIQVLTGVTKNKEVKVSAYSGTFNISVMSYSTGLPLKNIGILVIPTNKFNYDSATSDPNVADYKGVSNDAGLASFKVPSQKEYCVFLYNLTTKAFYGYHNYKLVQTNQTEKISMIVYNP